MNVRSILFLVLTLGISKVSAADSLGSILDRVYLPEAGQTGGKLRAEAPAKASTMIVSEGALLDRISAELTKALNPEGELRLSFGRAWQPIRVPSEDWEVVLPELPIGGISKSFLLRVQIQSGGRAWFDRSVVIHAQLWKQVFVSTRRLSRGQQLDETSAQLQVLDVLRDRLSPIAANSRLEELEVLQAVAERSPLTTKDVATSPMVRKGAIVEVIAGDGPISISMKGMAMAGGSQGDLISIRNMDTRKDFRARVVGRNSVQVTF